MGRAEADLILELVETGPGRRDMPLPVRATYPLAELLPRRQTDAGYHVPGEMGAQLAAAFGRAFALLERGHGSLAVQAPSKLLTPRWHRVLNYLRRQGLARTLRLSLPLAQGVPIYYFDIAAPFLGHRTDGGHPAVSRYSRGFSQDYDHALAKAVGECLERGPLLYFRYADLVRGSARSLRARGLPFLHPLDLCVFSPWQKERRPALRVDDESVFHWTWCKSLSSREALVPAQLVFWNYATSYGDVPEPMLRECSTHGAGGFFSLEGAILSGLSEWIQRDGFFLHWLRRLTPRRIDPAGVQRPATVELMQCAREVGMETLLLDVTSDLGIPTCVCALVRQDQAAPHVSMGASCRLDGESAIHDALLEAASVHHLLAQTEDRFTLEEGYEPFCDASLDTDKRLAFWANPEHAEHLAFFLEGKVESVSEFGRGLHASEDPRKNLEVVAELLRSRGMDVWYYQAHHEALDQLGYASVKVIVPDLVPLYYDERNAPLGHARLHNSPLISAERASAPFNRWPHPFP